MINLTGRICKSISERISPVSEIGAWIIFVVWFVRYGVLHTDIKSQIWGFPFNIYTMAEASDFKFGTQLGFAKAPDKITPVGKSGCGPGLGNSSKFGPFGVALLYFCNGWS